MSTLAKVIKAFCVPSSKRIVWGDGRVEKSMECPAWPCQDGISGETKDDFKHNPNCPLSLLKDLGDTEALHKWVAMKAHHLDYEGGGINSCPICKGNTSFRGTIPRHLKNCPGAVAQKTAPKEWFLEAGSCTSVHSK